MPADFDPSSAVLDEFDPSTAVLEDDFDPSTAVQEDDGDARTIEGPGGFVNPGSGVSKLPRPDAIPLGEPPAEDSGYFASLFGLTSRGALNSVANIPEFGTRLRGYSSEVAYDPKDQPEFERLTEQVRNMDSSPYRSAERDAKIRAMKERAKSLMLPPAKDTIAGEIRQIADESPEAYNADPRSMNPAAQAGRGSAVGLLAIPTLGVGGPAGLALGGAQFASQAYSESYTEAEKAALAQGMAPADARVAASNAGEKAALKTGAAMPVFMGAGRLGGALGSKLAGEGAGPIQKALTGFATALPANTLAGAGIRAAEANPGERLAAAMPTIETLTMDAAFAGIHVLPNLATGTVRTPVGTLDAEGKIVHPDTPEGTALRAVAGLDATKPTEAPNAAPGTPMVASEANKATETAPAEQRTPEPLNDWTQATADRAAPEFPVNEAPAQPEQQGVKLGVAPPGAGRIGQMMDSVKTAVKSTYDQIKSIPAFTDFRKSLLNWSARGQESTGEIRRVQESIAKAVPDPIRRAGITNYIQAAGDPQVLADRANQTSGLKLKKGYQAALNLTPEEKVVAEKTRETYDILLKRANKYGIEIPEIENYVTQLWKREPLKNIFGGKKLKDTVQFAKKRFYQSFFEGEQAGLKPETKDIGKLLPIYMAEVNNAINNRRFVEQLSTSNASDGRPLLAPRGRLATVQGDQTGDKAYLVFPEAASKETSDYKVLEQPALHSWNWRGADEQGNPIMVKSDLAVHPEAASHLKNVLGQSAIREWWNSPSESNLGVAGKRVTKFLVDDVQQVMKATMLGFLSPFHAVQEGTHAVGHKINPFFNIPKVDLRNPEQMDAAQHGLMILPDRVSAQQFREGLDGSSKNLLARGIAKLVPKAGPKIKEWADNFQHWLFESYIPGLKIKTYNAMLERNTSRYQKELASGEITPDQVKYLSATQSNAAYGHLNYADMGRNPTLQHIAQTFLLAPDFLEARGRFAAQAVKGVAGKVGREQLAALGLLGAAQWGAARILNKLTDDDWHFDEPFSVRSGNRSYTMRSVPEDLYKAFHDTRKFVYGRLSPVIGRGVIEGLSGVNYRGEPVEFSDTLKNIAGSTIPLSVQPLTRGLTEQTRENPVSPMEQMMGSLGVHVSRYSPVSEVYGLAKDWKEKHGKEFGLDTKKAVYPISDYAVLRNALDDNDNEKAMAETKRLMTEKSISRADLKKRFKESVHHSWTGKSTSDAAFKKSLKPDDLQKFNSAVKRRQTILERFDRLK